MPAILQAGILKSSISKDSKLKFNFVIIVLIILHKKLSAGLNY